MKYVSIVLMILGLFSFPITLIVLASASSADLATYFFGGFGFISLLLPLGILLYLFGFAKKVISN